MFAAFNTFRAWWIFKIKFHPLGLSKLGLNCNWIRFHKYWNKYNRLAEEIIIPRLQPNIKVSISKIHKYTKIHAVSKCICFLCTFGSVIHFVQPYIYRLCYSATHNWNNTNAVRVCITRMEELNKAHIHNEPKSKRILCIFRWSCIDHVSALVGCMLGKQFTTHKTRHRNLQFSNDTMQASERKRKRKRKRRKKWEWMSERASEWVEWIRTHSRIEIYLKFTHSHHTIYWCRVFLLPHE